MFKSLSLALETKRSEGGLTWSIKHLLWARHITHYLTEYSHQPQKAGILSPYTKKETATRLAKGVTQLSRLSCVPYKDAFKP